MPVRLHRGSALPDDVPSKPRAPAPSAGRAAAPSGAPRAPEEPSPKILPPPVTLSLPKPIVMESPLKRAAKPLAIAAGIAFAGTIAWTLRPSPALSVEATPLAAARDVVAPVSGVVERIAAPGAILDAGAELARVVPPATTPAAVVKLEAELERAERRLVDARRELARVQELFRTERATRRERDDASRLARRREEDRDAARAALDDARAAAVPAARIVAAPEDARVLETVPEGSAIEAGAPLARLAPRRTALRFEAEGFATGDELTAADGRIVRVTAVEGAIVTAEMDGEAAGPVILRARRR